MQSISLEVDQEARAEKILELVNRALQGAGGLALRFPAHMTEEQILGMRFGMCNTPEGPLFLGYTADHLLPNTCDRSWPRGSSRWVSWRLNPEVSADRMERWAREAAKSATEAYIFTKEEMDAA